LVRKKIIDENLLNKKRHTLFTAERYCHIIEQQSGLHSSTKLYINNQHPCQCQWQALFLINFNIENCLNQTHYGTNNCVEKKNEFEIFGLI
jgi:hypothetical protein